MEKRWQLRRVRGYLAVGVWVEKVGRGSGISGKLPGFSIYFDFHHERRDGENEKLRQQGERKQR